MIQEVESPHSQTVISEIVHLQSKKDQPFWLTGDFLSDLPIDPQGEFHRDFEILQLQSEHSYPSLPSPANANANETLTRKIPNSDTVTNKHANNDIISWNGPKPAPQKKVRPLSLSSGQMPQPPAARHRRKKVGETTELYKAPYRPSSSPDTKVDTPSSIQSRPYDTHRKARASMPILKKKKINFGSFTSLPVLNHESQLSSQQQYLCDMMVEKCHGEKEEEEEEEEEEKEEKTIEVQEEREASLEQLPLYSLHNNRKSEKQKSQPKRKKKSNFTYFRKSTKDPEDICITEQPIPPADDVWSYCKLSSVENTSSCAVLPALYDSGNMSYSVISYRVYQHLQKQGSVPDLLPYHRRVRGVGGRPIKCYGTTSQPLLVRIPGLKSSFQFQCLVIDTPALHLNISLRSLKDMNITLNFHKDQNTTLTCRDDKCTITLQRRGDLALSNFITPKQACTLNSFYTQYVAELSAETLMEINQIETFIPTQLKSAETLSRCNASLSVHENFVDAQISSMEVGNICTSAKSDEHILKQCRKRLANRKRFKGDQDQILHPMKSYLIPPRCQIYIQCQSRYDLGTEYFAESNYYGFTAMGLAFPSHLGICSSNNGVIYIPVVNLQNHPVKISPLDPLIWAHALNPHQPAKESIFHITVCDPNSAAETIGHGDPGTHGFEAKGHRDPGDNRAEATGHGIPGKGGAVATGHWEPGEGGTETTTTTAREKRSLHQYPTHTSSRQCTKFTPNQSSLSTSLQSLKRRKIFDLANRKTTRYWEPIVAEKDIISAETRAFEASKGPPYSTQPSTVVDKKAKLHRRQLLSKLENITPSPGLWVQGEVKPPETKLNYKEIEEQTQLYYAKEASKIPLWTDSKENLDKFFTQECKFDSNPILKEHPTFLPRILNSLYINRKAFTTHDSHPLYLEEVGNCRFFRYHPQLIEGYENHIFSCPVTKMDRHSEENLLRILLKWEKYNILARQDVRAEADFPSRPDHEWNPQNPPLDPEASAATFPSTSQPIPTNPYNHNPKACEAPADTSTPCYTPKAGEASPHSTFRIPNPKSHCPTPKAGEAAGGWSRPDPAGGWSRPDPNSHSESQRLPHISPEHLSSPLRSSHNFRIVLVNKKEINTSGARPIAKRFTLDLRSLNKLSVQHKFHLQSASSHLANLVPGKVFNTMDFSNFYSSVNLTKRGSELFSFNTERFGSFSFLRIPQGYCNSPHIASQLANQLAAELPPHYISIFSDDSIQIGQGPDMSQALENLLHKMTLFLKQVIRFGLLINPEKCSLFLPQVQFLGFLISEHSISMKQDCMDGIVNYIVPSEPRSLKRFLGIITYYSHMIPNLSRYTANLFSAANRNTPDWKLTSQELTDFLEVKRRFLRSPALGFPQLENLRTSPLRVYLDWSRLSISVALTQMQYCPTTNTTVEKLISCCGRKNPNSLREASSTRGESSALLLATSKYRHFLILAPFLVFTDNLSLFFLSSLRNISGHYHRLFESLSEFTFYLYTLRSSQNSLCDFLSREHMPPMSPAERKLLLDNSTEVPKAFDNISIPHLPPQISETTTSTTPFQLTPVPHFWQKPLIPRSSCVGASPWNTLLRLPCSHPIPNDAPGRWHALPQGGLVSPDDYLVQSEISCRALDPLPDEGFAEQVAAIHPCHYFDPSHLFSKSESFTEGISHLTPDIPLYDFHQYDPIPQTFCDRYPQYQSSSVCSRFAFQGRCAHTKLSYPPMSPGDSPMSPDDIHISETLCLPTLSNSDLKAIFGPSLDLLTPISRSELLENQQNDPDLVPLFQFFNTGFPSIQQFHRLYQSERTGYYFSKRKLLRLQIDGVLHLARTPSETVLSQRVILPINLIYKALLLSHTVGNSMHKSILDTYNEINTRFSVYRLQDHVRYFIRSCEFCFLAKKPKPTQQQIPSLYPNFLKAKSAQPDSLAYTDLTGTLPVTSNLNTVIAFYFNFYSGHVMLYPMKDSTTASVLLSLTQYIASYPISHLVSDGASYYTSSKMQQAMSELRIQHSYAPVMNPASSRTERAIREAKVLLRVLLSTQSDHSNWDLCLGTVQLALNSRINPDTGLSPQELTSVFIPTSPIARWVPAPPYELSLEPGVGAGEVGAGEPSAVPGGELSQAGGRAGEDHATRQPSNPPTYQPPSPLDPNFSQSRIAIGKIPMSIIDSYRISHPHKIQSQINFPRLDLHANLLAQTIYAHSVIAGKVAAYNRSQAVYSRHNHPLWPLGEHSLGTLVWRYIQRPVAKGFSQSLVSRWCGIWKICHISGESFCCLESLFTIQGKTVYMDSSISLLWPFHHPSLIFPPTSRQRPFLDTRAGSGDHASVGDVEILEVPSDGRQPDPCPQAEVPSNLPGPGAARGCRALPPTSTTTLTAIRVWPPPTIHTTWPHLSDPPAVINELLQIDDDCTFFIPPIHISLMTQTEETQQLLKSINQCADIPSSLLFHKILPINCTTRAASSKMQKRLDDEYVLMSSPPPPTHPHSTADEHTHPHTSSNKHPHTSTDEHPQPPVPVHIPIAPPAAATAPPAPSSAQNGEGVATAAPPAWGGVVSGAGAAHRGVVVNAGTAAPEDAVVDAGRASQDHAHTQAAPEDVVVDAGNASQDHAHHQAPNQPDHNHPLQSPVRDPSNAPPEQFYTPGTPKHHQTGHRARLNKFISHTPEALLQDQHSSPNIADPSLVTTPATSSPPAQAAGLLPPPSDQPAALSQPSVPTQATGAPASDSGGGAWIHRALRRLAGVNAPGLSESDTPLGRTRSQKPPSHQ